MGVTMTVANMLSMLALSGMTASLPAMTRAVATREWVKLDRLFWRSFRLSCIAFAAGTALFVIVRCLLEWITYDERFLTVTQTVGLLIAMGFHHVAGLFTAYFAPISKSHFYGPC
jgi:hypothetical protein